MSFISNGINTYVRPKLNNLGLLLPPNFDCRILFDLVKSKAKVFNSNISLSFQHPVHGYVMNILDEADVHQLRNVIFETKEIVHLYLEVFQGLVEQTEAAEKVVPYNVENIVSNNVEECPEEETVALNTVEEKNLYEFGRLTDKTFSDGEESNEGWSEDEFTHGKKASDIFYGMPPILDCLDPIVEPEPFPILGPNDDIFVRQTYDNKQQLIFALNLKATREKFQFKTKHSNKNRYEVYCEIENYSWRLYAKRLDPTDEFEIRTFNNIHPNHKHANKKVMGTILHELMGKTRSKVWRPNEISRDLNALLEINVDYKQAWRAKQYAMELLLGSSEECFSKLPIYFHNLKRHNPGTVAYIQTDSEDCFECCFYAIGSTIRAFISFCCKVIIMDGAHLKGDFKGTILHAVAMDGNNQILPLVHGICKKESGLTWTWFLEKLYECVGDCQELTFVTDRADAIRVSIENVFSTYSSWLFGKNDKTKVLFWRLVKAYKRNVFEELWYRFSSTRPQVVAYLSEIPRAKWTRAYSSSKHSMNALSVDARKMPIIPLLEFFRRLSQEWCNKRRIEGGKRSTVLTEWAEKVVSKNEERTAGWSVSGVSDALYEVHDFKHGGIVDLRQETCTCKYWEGTGLPCGHVIMVLKHMKKTNFGHLAIDAYKMETYRNTYEEPVYSLPEPCDWEIPADMMVVKPPIVDTRQASRPRNRNRIPSQGEEPIIRRCIQHIMQRLVRHWSQRNKKKARKTSVASGSNTKGKGKGTEGTQETLETHGTQETRWTSGTQREDYCSTFDLND
uniref:SWIM-type domain-containing protein n=1 Tax=Lactuca sativa TaxID=4236 RepID=A0A9R1UZL0_LACSA|nr:hypothetical protein LSAT_V11C700383390 [Lactuca sativa]